jgi:3-hydroxyisobutyrate dehydrogenase/glyoxylate/succinic semialdehyde reductase
MNVAFIGLGIMGSRMAAHLLEAGHTLIVYNRSQAKTDTLIKRGAIWAKSPSDAVTHADVVITMLAHPDAVSDLALGSDGFLAAMKAGSLWVDSSTLHPNFSQHLATQAKAQNIHFLDAPVAGSKQQAEGAQLVFFVGGHAEDVATAKPFFEVMGRAVVHVGTHGMGTSLKMVVNHQLASSMAVFSEGIALGQALGISENVLLNTLVGGPVTPPYLASKREKLESHHYSAEFPLKWIHKDLQMVQQAAQAVDAPVTLAERVRGMYASALEHNLGEADFSALYSHLLDPITPSNEA